MSDTRGKGYETPAVENPPYDVKENFEVPEKDSSKHRKNRAKGQTAPKSQKVRTAPSHK
jgi:hypothetical protein